MIHIQCYDFSGGSDLGQVKIQRKPPPYYTHNFLIIKFFHILIFTLSGSCHYSFGVGLERVKSTLKTKHLFPFITLHQLWLGWSVYPFRRGWLSRPVTHLLQDYLPIYNQLDYYILVHHSLIRGEILSFYCVLSQLFVFYLVVSLISLFDCLN